MTIEDLLGELEKLGHYASGLLGGPNFLSHRMEDLISRVKTDGVQMDSSTEQHNTLTSVASDDSNLPPVFQLPSLS